jgi:hypothetical protein
MYQEDSMKKIIFIVLALTLVGLSFLGLVGCESDAAVASRNLSKEADMFRIYRRVVFFNGITDEYLLQIEGYCSVDLQTNGTLKVTVKTGDGEFLKHYLGLSDNVSYFVEQLDPALVSDDRYKVFFKPSVIIPNIELAQ